MVLVCFQEREGVGVEFPGGGVGVVGEELLEVAVEFRARGSWVTCATSSFHHCFSISWPSREVE